MSEKAEYTLHYLQVETTGSSCVAGERRMSSNQQTQKIWGEEQLAERLTVMEDCLIARLIGQHIKRSVHFPVRIHPTGYFLLPDVEKLPSSEVVRINTVILNAVFLPGQPDSRRAELLVGALRRIEWLLVDQKQVSNVFMLNLHQQHTFFPSPPQLKLGFTLLSNELKLRAVSPFNSPTPSCHYSPNYRHPIQRISYSSWHVRSIRPVLSLSSTTKRWRSDKRSILPDSQFNGSSKALKCNFLAELTVELEVSSAETIICITGKSLWRIHVDYWITVEWV